MKSNYETPDALRHDSQTVANQARALLEATAQVRDEKVAEVRQRLTEALECAKETYHRVEDKATAGARQADSVIRSHPYESVAVAAGLGALVGMLLSRRH